MVLFSHGTIPLLFRKVLPHDLYVSLVFLVHDEDFGISLIFLLYQLSRTDDLRVLLLVVSDPPQNRGGMRSRTDGIWNMPLYRPAWGRSRPHLSLREGLETAAISGPETTETEL